MLVFSLPWPTRNFRTPREATMQRAVLSMLVVLLSLSCAAALTCRPQLRASQPARCVRASPPSMTSEADLLRLQEEIQRLQLQAEIIRLQAQAEAEAVAAPVVPEVVALPQLTAPVPEPVAVAADVAERIVAVKDTLLPSSSPVDDVAAAAAAAVGAGAQGLVTNIDPGSSVGLDRVRSYVCKCTTQCMALCTMHCATRCTPPWPRRTLSSCCSVSPSCRCCSRSPTPRPRPSRARRSSWVGSTRTTPGARPARCELAQRI